MTYTAVGFLYYPIDASPPFKSVVLIDAFGSEPGLINWAQFYASHGYIAMSIGNLDETLRDSNSDWDYMDRAIALLSAIETVKSENERQISPLFNMIDTSSLCCFWLFNKWRRSAYCFDNRLYIKNWHIIKPSGLHF